MPASRPPSTCPDCQKPLVPQVKTPGVVFHQCPQGHGYFTDDATLGSLLPRLAPVAPEPSGPEAGAVPPDDWLRTLHVLPGETRTCAACGHEQAYGVSPTRGTPPLLHRCPQCSTLWCRTDTLAVLRVHVQKLRQRVLPAHRPTVEATIVAHDLGGDRISFSNPWVNGLAVPLALLLGIPLSSGLTRIVMHYFVTSWAHEGGHALMSWLSGRPAIPSFLITFTAAPSTLFSLAVSLGLGTVTVVGWRGGSWRNQASDLLRALATLALRDVVSDQLFLNVLSTTFLVLQIYLTWIASESTSLQWIIAGGCGGEIVISGLLVVAFFHPMPDRYRWDFWRFPMLGVAAPSLVGATRLWLEVANNPLKLPVGSAYGGAKDAGGDMNRLLHEYGWSAPKLASLYLAIALFFYVTILVHYIYFLNRSRKVGAHGVSRTLTE